MQPFAHGRARNIDLFDHADIDIVHPMDELFTRNALVRFRKACAGNEGFKAGRVVGVENVIFAGSRLLLQVFFVGRVVYNAEGDEDGKKDVQKAVHLFRDVDFRKCFYAKDDECGDGSPEGPRFETILHVVFLLYL